MTDKWKTNVKFITVLMLKMPQPKIFLATVKMDAQQMENKQKIIAEWEC